MAAISGIEAVGAPALWREQNRSTVDFGGAVTHRDLVREKLRVDPASLANKKRAPDPARPEDPEPQDSDHAERFAEEVYDPDKLGQIVDVKI